MPNRKACTADEAVTLIQDNQTVACAGFIGSGHPESLTSAIERRWQRDNQPHDLTLLYAAGQGDGRGRGLDHLAYPGLLRRVIGGHWGLCPKLGKMALTNQIEAYNFPQGVISQLYRDIAAGRPGCITHVGLGTFVDPVTGNGGKLNNKTVVDLVSRFSLPEAGPVLWYKSLPIHVALIRVTTADRYGNLSMENEAIIGDVLPLAQAASNSGGIVLAQVERITDDEINPHRVRVPGVLVDRIVLADSGEHERTFGGSVSACQPEPMSPVRRIIATRALMEIQDGSVGNLGIGIPECIARIAAEQSRLSSLTLTVESGTIGGEPSGGLSFGASRFPQAIIDSASQFDWYDGGGLDFGVLGMAQVDKAGNVNVSRFGGRFAGAGGFVNISQNARKVIFCGTLLASGGQKKFVRQVEAVCFSAAESRRRSQVRGWKQEVLYVTEQAVFRLADGDGLELVEVAPGVDEFDVFRQMEFTTPISSGWRKMPGECFPVVHN